VKANEAAVKDCRPARFGSSLGSCWWAMAAEAICANAAKTLVSGVGRRCRFHDCLQREFLGGTKRRLPRGWPA